MFDFVVSLLMWQHTLGDRQTQCSNLYPIYVMAQRWGVTMMNTRADFELSRCKQYKFLKVEN